MKTEEEVQEEVKKVVEGDEVDTPPTETPKEETSKEVKTEPEAETEEVEETPEKPKEEVEEIEKTSEVEAEVEDDNSKKTSKEKQISNLNIALQDERRNKREDSEKIAYLQKELNEKTELLDKSKEVEPTEDYEGLTAQQVEEIFERKTEERRKEESTAKLAADTKLEINTLVKEYDGKDGKPLYEDAEVFKWQKKNIKLHLSPKEAFDIMKHNELIDYEVNQRLAGKKTVKKVEKSSTVDEVHKPVDKKEGPVNDSDMGKMVSEAINDVEREI